MHVLTTQGNPLVTTALPIAETPVATVVAMAHFVVAKGSEKNIKEETRKE